MNRKLKSLGIALFAIFAVSAIGASGASAAGNHTFHSEDESTFLTAEADEVGGVQVLEATPGEEKAVECEEVNLGTGTTPGSNTVTFGEEVEANNWRVEPNEGDSKITVHPVYSECEAVIGESKVKASVDFTECNYVFTSTTDENEHAEVKLECPQTPTVQEVHIKVTALNLKCNTFPQQEVSGVHYYNTGAGTGRDITIEATATGITSTTEGACGSGTHDEGTLTGNTTVTGDDEDGNPVGIWTVED